MSSWQGIPTFWLGDYLQCQEHFQHSKEQFLEIWQQEKEVKQFPALKSTSWVKFCLKFRKPLALHTLTHRYQLEVKNGASHQDSIPLVGIYHRHSMWRQRFYKSRETKEIFVRLLQ
jgi:hypothetical protein